MKHLKKFNEDINDMGNEERLDYETSEYELPKEKKPLFSIQELEAAFLSSRIVDQKGQPQFKYFKDWYISELGSGPSRFMPEESIKDIKDLSRDYSFDAHTRFPFNKKGWDQFIPQQNK